MPPKNNAQPITNNPPQDPKPQSILKQIRTFQGDVAEALGRQKESLVSIQRAEHLKSGPPKTSNASSQNANRRNLVLLSLGSAILLLLGITGAWYTYNEFIDKSVSPVVTGPANRFISVNTERSLDLANSSRETFLNAISNIVESIPAGEIGHIILKEEGPEGVSYHLSIDKFLNVLDSRAPGALVRALDPLFMFGSFGNSPFLIIKLTSFENAFAGMLNWEKNLATDFGPLFIDAESLKNIPLEPVFTDVTDRNKDARVFSLEGKPVILYSFFDNNMLIITDNVGTLRTLIDRLTREKLSR